MTRASEIDGAISEILTMSSIVYNHNKTLLRPLLKSFSEATSSSYPIIFHDYCIFGATAWRAPPATLCSVYIVFYFRVMLEFVENKRPWICNDE